MKHITIWHGEGKTLYYIVEAGSCEEDWEIIKTCDSLEEARKALREEG